MNNKAKAGAQQKVVDDKTFGLKNKNKSKKVQQYVQQVTQASKMMFRDEKKDAENAKAQKAKDDKKRHKEEMAELFKQTVVQPKVPFGVDPKTMACAFFVAGMCKKKGDVCKFSHDQTICFGKKKAVGNSIDLSVDVTAGKGDKKEEDIAITDPVELAKAIEKKAKQMACETHIVCKHFLTAIESKKYGWFWDCPDNLNGNTCKYRHALPPGYVFKDKKKTGEEDDEDELTLEERLDQMRKGVGPGAMVTAETFAEWKQKRIDKANAEQEEKDKLLQKGYKKGNKTNMTGRQLFEFDSSIFVDDADASGADVYVKEFEDAEDAALAKEDRKLTPDEAAAAEAAKVEEAASVELPEGIEENLFLDEDLDDLPSDDED